MIEIQNVSKNFGDIKALSNINLTIRQGEIFGMVGSNGAGKSTLLRIISGVLKTDTGSVSLEAKPIYENPQMKAKFFYISDNQHFLSNATPDDMFSFYAQLYEKMDYELFTKNLQSFELEKNRKVRTFSKGMKKQLSTVLGLSSGAEYLLCDESFDGLDPIAKQVVKFLFKEAIAQRKLTPIIASHNLRELEDLCDHVGLLHRGGVILSRDIGDMKLSAKKVQAVFTETVEKSDFEPFDVINIDRKGSVYSIVLSTKGTDNSIEALDAKIRSMNPIFYEMLPLSLEEIFITESEVAGYDIRSIIS